MESTMLFVRDENNKPLLHIFTRDTLFVGDVGRPDLSSGDMTKEELVAGIMYDTIQQKILPLEGRHSCLPAWTRQQLRKS